MATLGNKVGPKQWDVYDKAEVEQKIVELASSEIDDAQTTLTNTWSASEISNKLNSLDISPILKPTITSPTNNTTDFIGEVTISYNTSDSYDGVQDYVKYEFATDSEFTNIVDTYEGNSNLTSYTPNIGIALTDIYARVKTGSDNHRSVYSDTIMFTTPNVYIETPTLTVDGSPNEVGKTTTLTLSAFSVYNGTDTQESADYQVVRNSDSVVVWESIADTSNLLSITTGELETSTEYTFRAKQNGTTYGSSAWVEVVATTKAQFTPTLGVQGEWGFGVAPTDEPFALLGLAELPNTNTYGHDEYGNYIHTNGSIVTWNPKGFYRVGHPDSPRYATYGENAIDFENTETFSNEAEANAVGYILPRCFINNGQEKSGFFFDKYINSKDGTSSSKSVFGGVPISLTTSTTYTNSNGMAGCTGIFADAVVLAKSRGERWNLVTAFQVGFIAMRSLAHAQAVTDVANCAWYDPTGTTNYPKGCNNNALSDVDDSSVVYATAGDSGSANKPKAGAIANFNKTTCNGCGNGIADVNGSMWEVALGITTAGSSATGTTAVSDDIIYLLKQSIDHAVITSDFNTATSVWGDASNLSNKYDQVVSPHPLGSSTGSVYWNSTNACFSNSSSGLARDLCGFIPKDQNSTQATGTNLFGMDYFYKHKRTNMFPAFGGDWYTSSNAGVFVRSFALSRSFGGSNYGFRASAYFG